MTGGAGRTRGARRRATSSRHGLTLVELLLAATIFSLLMVGVVTHLRGGLVAWRRATSTLEHLQRLRVTFDLLAGDLANAVVVDATGQWTPAAQWDTDAMAFYTVRPPEAEDELGRLRVVRYDVAEEAAGGRVLRRSLQSVREAHAGLPEAPTELLSRLDSLRVRYGASAPGSASILWEETWLDPTSLPLAVEMVMEGRWPGAIPRRLRRVFWLPTGGTPSGAAATAG